jgi:TRAP-type mannitol/chloroaromatic compound transport system permease small subunit
MHRNLTILILLGTAGTLVYAGYDLMTSNYSSGENLAILSGFSVCLVIVFSYVLRCEKGKRQTLLDDWVKMKRAEFNRRIRDAQNDQIGEDG